MKTPFSTEQFFDVIEKYNANVFPMQFIFLIAGLILLWVILTRKNQSTRLPGIFIGTLWLWIGIVYHILFFTSINTAAFIFGGLFILQGLFMLYETFFRSRMNRKTSNITSAFTGYFLIIYGLIVYPVVSLFTEGFFTTISIGLPCPTTIITFGVLLVFSDKLPRYLLVIPTLWSLLGISAALNFGVYQDFVMVAAAIVANFLLFRQKAVIPKMATRNPGK